MSRAHQPFRVALAALVPALCSACVPLGVGRLDSDLPAGRWITPAPDLEMPQGAQHQPSPNRRAPLALRYDLAVTTRATPPQAAVMTTPAPLTLPEWSLRPPPLSPGDRLRVSVTDGPEFSGLFELDIDGSLSLPYLPPLHLAGLGQRDAEARVADALVNAAYFRRGLVQVALRVQQWSAVQVNVSGAVFAPGLVTINVRRPEEKAQKSLQHSGDFPPDRLLPAALRAAGGVRPDADVQRIHLVRDGEVLPVDLGGLFHGVPAVAIPLMAGDALIVPSTGRYDEQLVKPTAITPPGIRIFLSNLTVPAPDNSKSAINQHATSVPYGTRMLTALISANCVGGTASTNSARHGVLVTRNPLNGETEVIERGIEDLLRQPEREELNPYVMPNDGLACYDSGVTNLRDIARTVADILLPFRISR